jgi:hypothetical protein
MRNEAKKMQNKTLSWQEEAKLSEMEIAQFRLHEPFKTILNKKETCETGSLFACFFLV